MVARRRRTKHSSAIRLLVRPSRRAYVRNSPRLITSRRPAALSSSIDSSISSRRQAPSSPNTASRRGLRGTAAVRAVPASTVAALAGVYRRRLRRSQPTAASATGDSARAIPSHTSLPGHTSRCGPSASTSTARRHRFTERNALHGVAVFLTSSAAAPGLPADPALARSAPGSTGFRVPACVGPAISRGLASTIACAASASRPARPDFCR